ncbi:hypothetical protein [Neisseria sicca]|uniref:hypothetical protein n=1 Tax=Neisseria sicca TaxID=490 RepID=UPI001649E52B|nr:hypothetical protein [Neisseria sicca]
MPARCKTAQIDCQAVDNTLKGRLKTYPSVFRRPFALSETAAMIPFGAEYRRVDIVN